MQYIIKSVIRAPLEGTQMLEQTEYRVITSDLEIDKLSQEELTLELIARRKQAHVFDSLTGALNFAAARGMYLEITLSSDYPR